MTNVKVFIGSCLIALSVISCGVQDAKPETLFSSTLPNPKQSVAPSREPIDLYVKVVNGSQELVDTSSVSQNLVLQEQAAEPSLKVFLKYSDGSIDDVSAGASWLEDDNSLAAVKNPGSGNVTVKAVKGGNTFLTASYRSFNARFPVAIKKCANIQLVQFPPATFQVGQSFRLKFLALYEDGSYYDITSRMGLMSSDPSILKISSTEPGLLTAIGAGTIQFTIQVFTLGDLQFAGGFPISVQ